MNYLDRLLWPISIAWHEGISVLRILRQAIAEDEPFGWEGEE